MDVGEEETASLLELKEGEEEDDAVVKSITKADVEELLGGSLEEDESAVAAAAAAAAGESKEQQRLEESKGSAETPKKKKADPLSSSPRSALPSLLAAEPQLLRAPLRPRFMARPPPGHFFPPPPPFHPFAHRGVAGGRPPPLPHPFMRPPLRRHPLHALHAHHQPTHRHELRFMHTRQPYNNKSNSNSRPQKDTLKKEEDSSSSSSSSSSTPKLQSLMSIKTSLPAKLLRPLKRTLQSDPPPLHLKRAPPPPAACMNNNNSSSSSSHGPVGNNPMLARSGGGPGQVHSNLRRIQTVDEPPPPKQRLLPEPIAHKPSPTLTRINITPGPAPVCMKKKEGGGTRIKVSNLPASATFEKMCSMTTAVGSVKTINILNEDNSAVIEFLEPSAAETFLRLNNRKMMDLSILNIAMV